MKKSIIALMGLFMLVACTEDSYQEADNFSETRTGDAENIGMQNSIKTLTGYYSSPFFAYGAPNVNLGVGTDFQNLTPFTLELEPYGADIHVQTFLNRNSLTYPPVSPLGVTFSPFQGMKFLLPPGAHGNIDSNAAMGVNFPPLSNPTGNIIYDFGNYNSNHIMYHYGKIHFFRYRVLFNGATIASGYIKQEFHNDTDDEVTVNTTDANWVYLTDVSGLPAMYDVVAMHHIGQHEICLTNKKGYKNKFPSKVTVTHPITGFNYTLHFYTSATTVLFRFN